MRDRLFRHRFQHSMAGAESSLLDYWAVCWDDGLPSGPGKNRKYWDTLDGGIGSVLIWILS